MMETGPIAWGLLVYLLGAILAGVRLTQKAGRAEEVRTGRLVLLAFFWPLWLILALFTRRG